VLLLYAFCVSLLCLCFKFINGNLIRVLVLFLVAERNGLCQLQGKVLESHMWQGPILGVYFPIRMYSHFGDSIENSDRVMRDLNTLFL
jgi:hypothetical protein